MIPKEKAKELCARASEILGYYKYDISEEVKDVALLCVKEIELYRRQIERQYDQDLYGAYYVEEYWKEVRKEINKL